MKSISKGQDLHEHHERCVCQICSCSKHRCPSPHVNIPLNEISSYQYQYVKHPINTWKKPPPEKAGDYIPFGDINSSYRNHYPGHKPTMRQIIVPRVKKQDRKIPFEAFSEYKNSFRPKSVPRERVFIKDMIYSQDNQPFNPSTTYGAHFTKQYQNPHQKRKADPVVFPEGYRFNPNTTYSNDFKQKSVKIDKNYKPIEKLSQTGPHDLNTIYRQDYREKPQPQVCPIVKLPSRPTEINHPSQHLTYNKYLANWVEK